MVSASSCELIPVDGTCSEFVIIFLRVAVTTGVLHNVITFSAKKIVNASYVFFCLTRTVLYFIVEESSTIKSSPDDAYLSSIFKDVALL